MNDCASCAVARANRHSGMYTARCVDCEMRGYARSSLAFDAVRDRSTGEIRAALALSHPQMPVTDALRRIWEWWRADHPQQEAA